ncbi:hypothetical protein [Chlorogloea sp. CCALA 695]|uniref:hypothetical protein n=1 Tax=Chlorogloea sp. CCALA 695 TaxID=2107693 RepID=UPI000D04D9B6|nr:hypothetical protein [Chlorogloea sp. CCALA 695]PSB29848.1 hypothetical protein C7B70_17515 [Chlorogloea sp. CCALA 695]
MTKIVAKEQLKQAFQQIVADKKKSEFKIATRQEIAEKEKDQQVLEVASTYTVNSIIKGLADLQLEFGGIIRQLSEKLANENSKLDELKLAIEIETQHLQELQEIRIAADTVHILNQEHQEQLNILEQNNSNQKQFLEKAIIEQRKSWQQEQSEYESILSQQNELLLRERQRETEDYQYRLELTRKINTDAYDSRKRNLEREVQEITQIRQKQWTERETILTEQQPLFKENLKKIESFNVELEEAIKKAREEAIRDVHQDAKVKADLFEKEWQSTKQNYELKVQDLEGSITKQVEQIHGLENQLQAAMKQSQDLAMRAFENASGKFTAKIE